MDKGNFGTGREVSVWIRGKHIHLVQGDSVIPHLSKS
jgi:hypothetical protein